MRQENDMIPRHFIALVAIVTGLGAGAAHAQSLDQHVDCAATTLLFGTIYPGHQPEIERRLSVIYDKIRADHTDLATFSDDQFNAATFEVVDTVLEETLAKGGEEGALAFLIRHQECEAAYGFEWLELPEGSQ
jgi:hypothetical protein